MSANEILIQIKFMGELADLAGCRQVTVALPAEARLAELVSRLGAQFGQKLARRLEGHPTDPFRYHVIAVVNSQFYGNVSESQTPLADGATVVFMEPVAGGSGDCTV